MFEMRLKHDDDEIWVYAPNDSRESRFSTSVNAHVLLDGQRFYSYTSERSFERLS